MRISDLETEIQECRALLDEANSRVEEKEFLIEEKDAQISVLEERGIEFEGKIQNLRSEHEQQGKFSIIWGQYTSFYIDLLYQSFKRLVIGLIYNNFQKMTVG